MAYPKASVGGGLLASFGSGTFHSCLLFLFFSLLVLVAFDDIPQPCLLLIYLQVFANVVSVAVIVAVHYGLGYHLFRVKTMDPSGHALVKIFLCVWLTATFNGPSMLATKIALLLWYRRLFIVQQLWLRIFWWINMVYIVLWAIGSTVSYMFSCVPIQYYWERIDHTSTVHGICRNTTTADGLPLILDLISDAAIMALPIATIATLQMPLARKVALMIVFSVGLMYVAIRPRFFPLPALLYHTFLMSVLGESPQLQVLVIFF